jgi:hypothetical protein
MTVKDLSSVFILNDLWHSNIFDSFLNVFETLNVFKTLNNNSLAIIPLIWVRYCSERYRRSLGCRGI